MGVKPEPESAPESEPGLSLGSKNSNLEILTGFT